MLLCPGTTCGSLQTYATVNPSTPWQSTGPRIYPFTGFKQVSIKLAPKDYRDLSHLLYTSQRKKKITQSEVSSCCSNFWKCSCWRKDRDMGHVPVQAAGNAVRSKSQFTSSQWHHHQQEPGKLRSQRKSGRIKASLQAAWCQSDLGWGEAGCFFNAILLSERVDAAVQLCQKSPNCEDLFPTSHHPLGNTKVTWNPETEQIPRW